MLSALLSRLSPYLLVALLASLATNWLLGHELLSKQEQLGEATQGIHTQAVTDALAGTKAARKGQSDADQATIRQLRQALADDGQAAKANQTALTDLRAALAAAQARLDHAYSSSPEAAAWAAGLIPRVVLDSGLCWYSDSAGWGAACDGSAGALGPDSGGGHGPLPGTGGGGAQQRGAAQPRSGGDARPPLR